MRKLTHEEFLNRFYEIFDNNYKILNDYETYEKPIQVYHNVCKQISEFKAVHILRGYVTCCKHCSGKQGSYQDKLDNIFGKNYYKVLGKYKNNKTKVEIKCPKGHITNPRPNDILFNKRTCSECKEDISKGESLIKSWLDSNNVLYEQQVKFPEFNTRQSFDFKVFYDDNTFCLIEFDGEQHFKKKFAMTDKELETQKKNDERKTIFCSENNIELIRINYKQLKSINKILNEYFL